MNRGLAISSTHIYLLREFFTFTLLNFCLILLILLISGTIMSENPKAQAAMARITMMTGGLVTIGSLGWGLFRIFTSQQIDYMEMIMYVMSFTGGMCILGSTNAFDSPKSNSSQEKSATSEKDALNVTDPICEASALATLLARADEWDQIFAHQPGKSKVLDKKISRNNKEADEVISNYTNMTKRLNDLNKQGRKNELAADTKMKTCYNGRIGSSKTKFRDEVISLISELKGYFQGTIYPLPFAKNIQLRSTDMSDEKRREIFMIINEYADSMLPKLEKIIEEFVDSVGAAGKVLNDKDHKVKIALETLGVQEKDFSTAPIKIEMDEYYNSLGKAAKKTSQMPSCQNGPISNNMLGASTRPLESSSGHNLQEIIWTKTSEPPSQRMPKAETSTGVSTPCQPRGVNKPSHHEVQKLANPQSKTPSKLFLDPEQIKCLNILKSELEDTMIL